MGNGGPQKPKERTDRCNSEESAVGEAPLPFLPGPFPPGDAQMDATSSEYRTVAAPGASIVAPGDGCMDGGWDMELEEELSSDDGADQLDVGGVGMIDSEPQSLVGSIQLGTSKRLLASMAGVDQPVERHYRACRARPQFKEESRKYDLEVFEIVRSLGGSEESYKVDRAAALRIIVSEIFSPLRVTAVAKLFTSLGLIPGMNLDITENDDNGMPWNFGKEDKINKAHRLIVTKRPILQVGTVICTSFCPWQALMDAGHCRFFRRHTQTNGSGSLYEMQLQPGMSFLHEHPGARPLGPFNVCKDSSDETDPASLKAS